MPVSTAASDHKGYIDVLIPSAKTIIEQKSCGIDLAKPEVRQGRPVTPAQQAKGYIEGMPLSQQPRYVIACNFEEFWVYDRERDSLFKEPLLQITLVDLPKNVAALQFLKGSGEAPASVSRAVSVEAGRIMGRIHAEIAPLYHDPDSEESHHALSVLCTRLMFLMFCEDAGLIEQGLFQRYIEANDAPHLRRALIDLFCWLDTPDAARADEYPDELTARFPYMDGGLFREQVPIPQLTENVRYEILVSGCQEFDWSGVDPTVFGFIFEGALSHDARRAGGMHYTSPENIHKVIDPLFLDGLKAELDGILAKQNPSARTRALNAYHERLGSLTFLDPACGSGNFLTETYMCLRRLENRVLMELQKDGQSSLAFEDVEDASPVKVTLAHFHGIEINDFACCVARTALWIAEKQADINTAKVVQRVYDELPLKEYDTIRKGNALRMDWNDVVPASECDYVMGNPPFIGASFCTAEQKADIVALFGKIKLSNSLDYVSGWYYKAAEMMAVNPSIKASLVSTNSICQGEQVAPLWGTLRERFDVHIDFAWRTFIWNSEAIDQAHVHCVIVGFSVGDGNGGRLFNSAGEERDVDTISPYLLAAPFVVVGSRSKPICDVPRLTKGSQASDGGNLILSDEEKDDLLKRFPVALDWVKPFVGAYEFLRGTRRWCLWLKNASPSELASCPPVLDRVRKVAAFRKKSSAVPTRKKADTPTLFFSDVQPSGVYIAVPRTSSQRRCYLPIGLMEPEIIASDNLSIVHGASLFMFGVLQSQVHNAWMRTIAGRLKSDYRYSGAVVYNNFVWPGPTPEQRAEVERCAQAVLDARRFYEGSTLADMYDPDNDFLYPELMRAHKALDAAVEAAYGVDFAGDEEKIVAHLFKLYAEKAGS